jgi:hypothetical protein
MRSKLLLIILVTIFTGNLKAQVGIGTYDPDTSVVLDIQSPNKGILLPRVTAKLEDLIQPEGSLIFDKASGKFKYSHQKLWISVNPLTTDTFYNITTVKDARIKGNLRINGAIDSAVTVNANITVTGTATANQINVTGNQSVGGNLTGRVTAGSFSGNGSLITAVDAATLGGSAKSYFAPEDSITSLKNRLKGKVSCKVSPPYGTVYWDQSSYSQIGQLVVVYIRFSFKATNNNRYLYIYVSGLPGSFPTSSTNIYATYLGTTIVNPPSSPDNGNCNSIHLTYFTTGNNGDYYLYAYTQDGTNFSSSGTNIIDLQFYYFSYSSNM